MAKLIALKSGQQFQVDDDVWHWAHRYRWYSKCGYACRYIRCSGYGKKDSREIYLHREVMGHPEGMEVHHQNGDRLNNQRENLRVVTRAVHRAEHRELAREARRNGPSRRGSASGLKGVGWNAGAGKWQVYITVAGRNLFLGTYAHAAEAGLVYDSAVMHYLDGRGYMNFLGDA
jgi:hypothetical protein